MNSALLLAAALCLISLGGPLIALRVRGRRISVIQTLRHEERLQPGLIVALSASLLTCAAITFSIVPHNHNLILFFAAALSILLISSLLGLSVDSSGHVTSAAAILALAIVLWGPRGWLLSPIVASVAWARLRLGVHTRADVIAGFATGFVVVWITYRVGIWIYTRIPN
jgi:membrane-associated phospholipid phosphatase